MAVDGNIADDLPDDAIEFPRPETNGSFRTMVVVEGGVGLVACILGWLINVDVFLTLRWELAAVVEGIAASIPMLLAMLLISRSRWPPFSRLTRIAREVIVPLFQKRTTMELIVVCGLAGWGEELLFRGLIQSGLEKWIDAPWAPLTALISASILFGLVHPLSKTYAVVACLISFYLGGIWLYTENLLVPMLAHGTYDFLALLYLLHYERQPNPPG